MSIGTSLAAGDFPVASCKSWNRTVVERNGIDPARASMRGIVTKADLQEYCERDPGGETKFYGGKLTTAQCVAGHLRKEARTMASEADCKAGTVVFSYGEGQPTRAKFPLGAAADTSCASAMPLLVEQFKMLCPAAAKRLMVE
ncbi:MAG: hypothetical protein Q7T93_00020 [Methylobacterium sp.]|uniref:hypothetical protein n=1 Tax=Methylobacterium sp. TaxID=409 RepID=UPI00271D48FB|nr:hypothetical protein [Methylobacterium sp.]MDO9425199.1 hypothetical protein [Methylobacterium sp.]